MKACRRIFLTIIIIYAGVAETAEGSIADTAHNLTALGGGSGGTRVTDPAMTVCGMCHLAHGGKALPGKPLWARGDNAVPPVYNLYGGGSTMHGTTLNNPGKASLNCLSCHDGTIGMGTIVKNDVTITYTMTTNLPGGLAPGGAFQPSNIDPVTGYSPYIGTDLMNDHPVGFSFPAGGYGLDGGVPGVGLMVVNSGTANAHLAGGSGATYPLFQSATSNDFECATCHDPHISSTPIQTKFLRSPNSLLCQDCHDKK